jgi:hypothetical protein
VKADTVDTVIIMAAAARVPLCAPNIAASVAPAIL